MARPCSSAPTSWPRSRRYATGSASCGPAGWSEVAGLADLRRLRVTEVTATFSGEVPDPKALADLPGVQVVDQESPTTIMLRLGGHLARRSAAWRRPSWPLYRFMSPPREIFLGYYGRAYA